MTPDQTATVLAKCAAVDQRTIGRADVLAWHELVGHLDHADALEAVKRWYGTHRDRIMPSDLLDEAKAIRKERDEQQHHPVRELPSKFEQDVARDRRIGDGMSAVRPILRAIQARLHDQRSIESGPPSPEDETRQRAIERARRDRREWSR